MQVIPLAFCAGRSGRRPTPEEQAEAAAAEAAAAKAAAAAAARPAPLAAPEAAAAAAAAAAASPASEGAPVRVDIVLRAPKGSAPSKGGATAPSKAAAAARLASRPLERAGSEDLSDSEGPASPSSSDREDGLVPKVVRLRSGDMETTTYGLGATAPRGGKAGARRALAKAVAASLRGVDRADEARVQEVVYGVLQHHGRVPIVHGMY
jgi:hypothetical protein